MSAFPLLPRAVNPTSIASRQPPVASRSVTRLSLKPIPPRRVLQPLRGGAWPCAAGASFSINPYRGCEIGCVYCHARFTHGFMDLSDWWDFERKIFFKEGAPKVLARELVRLGEASIALGTITDPYQPAEERLRLTRGILEAILHAPGRIRIQVNTKSDLILRDLDLLSALSRRGAISVQVTITTLLHDLAKALEPRAPSPRRRLEAIRHLRKAGIPAGVLLMPLIPGVNDAPESIEAVAREARAAGAISLAGAPLILRPQASEPFFRFLRREYPQLERTYREAFEASARVPEEYRRKVHSRMARALKVFGLADWPFPSSASSKPRSSSRRGRNAALTLRQLEIPGL